MWELLQSSIIPVIIVVILLKLFGGSASPGSSKPTPSSLDMDILKGATVVKKDKSKRNIADVFAENDLVLLYFSAHWCPPCRMFTPVLAEVYKALKSQGKKFEVVFLSSDRSEDQMYSYMEDAHGDWFALEYASPLKEKLGDFFGIRGIPSCIVLSGAGLVVSKNAREDITKNGAGVFEQWLGAKAE